MTIEYCDHDEPLKANGCCPICDAQWEEDEFANKPWEYDGTGVRVYKGTRIPYCGALY